MTVQGERTWAAWLTGVLGSFAVLEYRALRSRRVTLSQALARWLGVHPRHRLGPALLLGFASVWLWLCVHVARWQPGRVYRLQCWLEGREA